MRNGEFEVGDTATDIQVGSLPVDAELRHMGRGYFVITKLPPKPLRVGDVIDTAEQAARLPVGSALVTVEEESGTAPSIKIGEDRWVFYSDFQGGTDEHNDEMLDGDEHRIVHIPDADAGAGSQAA